MVRRLAREEGIFCGLSSGAAVCAAIREANKLNTGNIVVILPDNGYRYISEGVF
jgi:cysteine synthase